MQFVSTFTLLILLYDPSQQIRIHMLISKAGCFHKHFTPPDNSDQGISTNTSRYSEPPDYIPTTATVYWLPRPRKKGEKKDTGF
ncbi:hypothetical protein JTE90_013134 [Oedothorax gibbosus]|uniref:Secreted protein n=1 Tax=Oedothorax gibbosus TaxID=931172 RepID=A0AAV6VK42_9ARAC|nr:hypothetical protein JTE90_013134 [Oedothorax gibbosus]